MHTTMLHLAPQAQPLPVTLTSATDAAHAAQHTLADVGAQTPAWELEEALTGLTGLLLAAARGQHTVDVVYRWVRDARAGDMDRLGAVLELLVGDPEARADTASWLLRMLHGGPLVSDVWQALEAALRPWTTPAAHVA